MTAYNQVALITTEVNCQTIGGALLMVIKCFGTRFESHSIKLASWATIIALVIGNASLAADVTQPELPQQVAKKTAM